MALRHKIMELKALVEFGGGGGHGGGGHGGGHGFGRHPGGIVGVGPYPGWWYGGCPPGYETMADGTCKKVEEAGGVAVSGHPKCPPGQKPTVGGTCMQVTGHEGEHVFVDESWRSR
jgi:hypothetical protein